MRLDHCEQLFYLGCNRFPPVLDSSSRLGHVQITKRNAEIEATNEPAYFATSAELRAWLEANHDQATELWVGIYKKGSGIPSINWNELVDEVLCYGWIDGQAKGIDEHKYMQRITPRRAKSTWSAINIKRVSELIEAGRMQPAGLQAFERRSENNSVIYSHEQQGELEFGEVYEQQFRANERAWSFFERQAGTYRRAVIWWVISAKREETRARRLAKLIAHSEQEQTVPQFTRRGSSA